MIDTLHETLVTLAQVPDVLPRRRRGRKLHVSTVHRWVQKGLETLDTPSGRITSLEAVQRFFERLTAARNGTVGSHEPARQGSRTAARRLRDAQSAGQQLEEMGA